jgi:5-methylcytosine-specific restriction endonuclease McrA
MDWGSTLATSSKLCNSCEIVKDVSAFNKNSSTKDGLQTQCRECTKKTAKKYSVAKKEYAARYREKNKEKIRIKSLDYRLKNKKQELARSKKHYEENKERYWKRNRQWAIDHPDKMYEYTKKWRKSVNGRFEAKRAAWAQMNPEKIRQYSATRRARKRDQTEDMPSGAYEYVLRYYGRCLYPGCDKIDGLHIDHVHSLSTGGAHSISNLQTLCAHHNISKGSKTIDYRNGDIIKDIE